MGSGLTSIFFSLGFGCWLYAKILSKTGGNTSVAIKASIGAGIAVFLFIYTLLRFVLGA